MSPEERAQHTHVKDDPQQWPGEVPPNPITIRETAFAMLVAWCNAAVIYGVIWLAATYGGWVSRGCLAIISLYTTGMLLWILWTRRSRRDPSGVSGMIANPTGATSQLGQDQEPEDARTTISVRRGVGGSRHRQDRS
jgi:hypothetical protein